MRRGAVIRFEGVDFKYPRSGSPYVLHDLDFAIPHGKVTALVGASGGYYRLVKNQLEVGR